MFTAMKKDISETIEVIPVDTCPAHAVTQPETASMVAEGFEEKRRYQRVQTEWTAEIWDGDKLSAADVLDMSVNGAKLRVKGAIPESARFKIKINGLGDLCAIVRWRKGTTMGVQFDENPHEIARRFVLPV